MSERPDLVKILDSKEYRIDPKTGHVIDPGTGMPHIPDWEIERREEERRRREEQGVPLYLPAIEAPYEPDDDRTVIIPPPEEEEDDRGYGIVIRIL